MGGRQEGREKSPEGFPADEAVLQSKLALRRNAGGRAKAGFVACWRACLPQRTSVWAATAQLPPYSPLTADITADVCVVGAGIAGLTTAYLLTQVGKSVVVLDDGAIGSGMTGATTAHLANALDDRYFELERLHGERGARLAAESHTAAIDRIESIVTRERIECDFERARRLPVLRAGARRGAARSRARRGASRRLHDVAKIGRAPLAFDTGPCLRFPNQAQFHPLKYLAGLAEAIERARRPHLHRHARHQIDGGKNASVTTESGTVRAERHRGGHQHAGQRPRRDPHQAGAVHDLRDRRARAARRGDHGALLGHRRSVSLRAPAAASTPSTTC